MKRSWLVALAAMMVGGVLLTTVTPLAAQSQECVDFSYTDDTLLFAPDGVSVSQGPWQPVLLPAGTMFQLRLTAYDLTHEANPTANLLQTNEIVALEFELASGEQYHSGVTADIPNEVNSAGPFNVGQFGPFGSDVVRMRLVHGAWYSGTTENLQSVHGSLAEVVCVQTPPSAPTTSTPVTTTTVVETTTSEEVTTTTAEVTTTSETTTSTSVPEATTTAAPTTEAPTTTAPETEVTEGGGHTLPETGASSTTGLALLGAGFVTFGAALMMSSRERRSIG